MRGELPQAPKVLSPPKGPSIDLRKGSVRLVEPKKLRQLGCHRRSSDDAALLTLGAWLAEPTVF